MNPSKANKNLPILKVAKKKDAELSDYVFGKVQPQAIDLEEAVLGAMLLDKDAITVVLDILRPESFYKDAHQMIYRAILKLFEKSHPVDLLTVTEELKKAGDIETVGGAYYLVELTGRIGSSANIEYHARIVSQKYIQRELIKVSTQIIRDAYEDTTDVFGLIEDAETGIFEVTQNGFRKGVSDGTALATGLTKELEAANAREDGLTGVPSSFTDLDRLTNGWQRPDLIILAARPGMGKSGLVFTMAANIALDFNIGVAVFSLEMSTVQVTKRMASAHCGISGDKLRTGKLSESEWQQLGHFTERVSDAPIFVDDTPAINIFELRAKCRRLKMQHNIRLVIVDYLQLMTGDSSGNREQEISQISRGLKGLAKELDVPVIALSQLSRAVETRGGSKRPQLSDLRESGAIEADADIVGFIYRPEYYGIMEDESGQSLKGVAEVIIAKHRNGALDTVLLQFEQDFARFSDRQDPNFQSGQFPSYEPGNVLIKSQRGNENEDLPF